MGNVVLYYLAPLARLHNTTAASPVREDFFLQFFYTGAEGDRHSVGWSSPAVF